MYDYAKCIFGKGNKNSNLMKSALKHLTSNKQPKKRYWRGDDEYNASRKAKMFSVSCLKFPKYISSRHICQATIDAKKIF